MKIRAAGAAAGVSAVLLAACGGNGAGTGGSTPAGGGTCSAPVGIADCGTCASQSACEMCASAVDQAGVSAYNALLDCISCTGCYTVCGGSADPDCMGPPSTIDACDNGNGTAACTTCQTCAVQATCAPPLATCKGIPQCVDLVTFLYKVCNPLPM